MKNKKTVKLTSLINYLLSATVSYIDEQLDWLDVNEIVVDISETEEMHRYSLSVNLSGKNRMPEELKAWHLKRGLVEELCRDRYELLNAKCTGPSKSKSTEEFLLDLLERYNRLEDIASRIFRELQKRYPDIKVTLDTDFK